ncbi:MAG: hypothetical protein WAL75_18270 [Terracidiphilus sp.]
MYRFVLLAIVLFESSAVFCQSTASPPVSTQVPGKAIVGQWPFDFGKAQPGQIAAKPTFKSFDCDGLNSARNQASAPIDLDHLFDVPCVDKKPRVELFAHNDNLFSQSPLVVRPHPKGEPIPTQWPNAKVENIPTEWPGLKLQPIEGGSQGLAPIHRSAK